jgi:aminopeptidase
MRERADDVKKLADLLVGFGANVQPGQIVGVSSYLGDEGLTYAIVRAAYRRGAKWVDVLWFDHRVKRIRLDEAAEDTLDYVPPWLGKRFQWLGEERAARVSLTGPFPSVYEGVDPARSGRDHLPYIAEVPKIVNDRTTNWTAGPAPNADWASALFPDLDADEALEKLWDQIIHVCRLDEADPIAAWHERMNTVSSASTSLTARRFDALHFTGPGTDLTVGLMPSSVWQAAEFSTIEGIVHYPNVPSEETFTTPDPERVDGVVTATMPLEHYGSIIEGIVIRFEGGRAAQIDATRGADALRAAAAHDDGASRLGEVALVDKDGRIGPLGTVFYDTLLDENAASHIALGNAYDFPVTDEAERRRINKSDIHIDFMIGGPQVNVDGLTASGERVPVLHGDGWQL